MKERRSGRVKQSEYRKEKAQSGEDREGGKRCNVRGEM
jgi:hypothetical protein